MSSGGAGGIRKVVCVIIGLTMISTIFVTAARVSGEVIFDEEFNEPTLSSDWVVNPGKGGYSLTDNPGYLRYIIDAWGWDGSSPPLQLVRAFSGDQWNLTTTIWFNMRPAEPTNNRNMGFLIQPSGPGSTTSMGFVRSVGVYDGNPASNCLSVWIGGNTQTYYFPNTPNPLPLERWYFEIERNKDYFAFRASNDGDDSTFEFQMEYTDSSNPFGSSQEVAIQASGWYGSNNPPGYADIDFIKVTRGTVMTNHPPVAVPSVSPSSGNPDTVFTFDASSSWDVEDSLDQLQVRWDWESDGLWDTDWSVVKQTQHQFVSTGAHEVGLAVTDTGGLISEATIRVLVSTPGVHAEPVTMISDLLLEMLTWNLSKSTMPSLTSKLLNAERLLINGNNRAAGRELKNFISAVTTMEGKKLTSAQADYCRASASAIMDIIKGLPVAVISGPSHALVGQIVAFDGSSSLYLKNAIAAWDWNMGDGVTMTGPIVEHAYAGAGTYVVSLVVTDSAGRNSSRASASIEILRQLLPPVVQFSVSVNHMDVTVEAPGSYDPDGTIVSYDWDFGDGGAASGLTATHTYVAPGTYNIALTLTDNDGLTNTTSREVHIADSPPTAQFTCSTSGMTVMVDALGSVDDYGIVSYSWDWGDGTSGTGPVATHTYASSYPPVHTVSSGISTSDFPPPFPVVGYVYAADGATPMYGCTVTVTNTRTGESEINITDYSGFYLVDLSILPSGWSYGDGILVSAEDSGLIGSSSGSVLTGTGYLWLDVILGPMVSSYTITLTVTDTIGQTSTASAGILIASPPVASFTYNISDYTVSVDASGSSAQAGIASYSWYWGDGTYGFGETTTHTYTPGTFTIVLTVTDTLNQISTAATQVAFAPYALAFTYVVSGLTVSVDASSSSGGSIVDYTWYWGDGSTGSGFMASHTYGMVGAYTISLVAAYDNGVTYSISKSVQTEEPSERTVDYLWYDMFNVPLGEWYDVRWNVYGDEEPLTDSYPYLYRWRNNPVGNDIIYTNMRLNISGSHMPEINMNDRPEFLPLFGTERGGNARLDWYMQYLTSDEVQARGSIHYPWNDGWMVNWKGTVTLDEQAAKAVLGITDQQFDDFGSWWAANNATFSQMYQDWITSESQRLDIYPMYWYYLTWLDWYFWCTKTGNEIVIHMDTVSWGMEAMMTRWMHESFMPTEWYFEGMDFHLLIGPEEAAISVDTAVEYAAYAWEDAGELCWAWEAMMQDYVPSSLAHPHSDFDKYVPFSYLNMAPGSAWYGAMMPYDYTPGAWNLSVGETLQFEWPGGDQLFLRHLAYDQTVNVTGEMRAFYLEPDGSDFPSQIAVDSFQRTITFTGPIDMWDWSRNQTAHQALASEWDRIGLLPWGIPFIEFGMIARPPGEDMYEPDDAYTQATTIVPGSSQSHSINDGGTDVDWVKFTLSQTSNVVIWTSGAWGDTRMWLFDSNGVPYSAIAYDDDSGVDLWSIIYAQLSAGTYYVKVDEYGNNHEIPSYMISLTVTPVSLPWITVSSPNGGESWQAGTTHTITWSSGNNPGSYVDIYLYKSGSYSSTIASWASNYGSYSWTISPSQAAGSDYSVLVYSTSTTASDSSDSYFSITSGMAELAPPHADYGLDTDGDGKYDYLVLSVSVNVSTAGYYTVAADLYDSPWNYFIGTGSNNTFLDMGLQTVSVSIDGLQIRSSGFNGPYCANIVLRDSMWNWLGSDTHATQAYAWDQFRLPAAEFAPPHTDHGNDTDNDGLYEYLAAEVSVSVYTAGSYRISSNLCDGTGMYWIDSVNRDVYLDVGMQTIELLFRGLSIFSSGIDGPYLVQLYLEYPPWTLIDMGGHTTQAYTRDQFQPPSSFQPPHTDHAIDTDGDGKFNVLVVDAVVNVGDPGGLEVYADLYDGLGNWITWTRNETYLGAGVNTVELRFPGVDIRYHGTDGPYRVNLHLYSYASGSSASDEYWTAPYLWTEFELPGAVFQSPHLDYGIDTSGDGLFEYLVIGASVNVSDAGSYYLAFDFVDANGSYFGYYGNSTYLNAGIQTVEIRVQGIMIYNGRFNGPFTVMMNLCDSSGRRINTDTYYTSAYSWTEFQKPTLLSPPHSDRGVDTNGDGKYDYLAVDVMVDATSPGYYRISGNLYNEYGNWTDGAENYTYLNTGLQVMELKFLGLQIRIHGADGPFRVDLELRDSSWNWLGSGSHFTAPYLWSDFQTPPAAFAPPHSDHGIDTDADGLYNQLVVDVNLDIAVAGAYQVNGYLVCGNSSLSTSIYSMFDVGIQTVHFSFFGVDIRGFGADGPYRLEMSLYDPQIGFWLESDTYFTSPYSWTDFQTPPAVLAPPHSDHGLDTNADGLYDYLIVEVRVDVAVSGNFSISGSFNDANWAWISYAYNSAYLTQGMNTIDLRLEGWKIYMRGLNGPLNVNIQIWGDNGNWSASGSYVTSTYMWSEFARPPSLCPPYSDYGLDTDSDGLMNYLVVQVTINVTMQGNYYMYSELYDQSWNSIGYASINAYLDIGLQSVELRYDGMRIRISGADGPYHVVLDLDDASLNRLDNDNYTTAAYQWTDFEPYPAQFEPSHSDYGIDTNGDGLFDYLVVEAAVNVTDAGYYQVSAYLSNYSGMMSFAWTSNSTYLDAGLRIVTLRFSGIDMRNSGQNGPYTVSMTLYQSSTGNWMDGDSYTTSAYLWSDFQTPPAVFAPPHSDHGLDTDGDGMYNYLVVEAVVEVSLPGEYQISATLYDRSWMMSITSTGNNTHLDAGIQTVSLWFNGMQIWMSGANGPYSVDLYLNCQSTPGWYCRSVYNTTSYLRTEFESPPAFFAPPHVDYGLDTDGDGLFDYLVVEVGVNVTVAGTYQIYGDLFYEGNDISWASATADLSVGHQTIKLGFEGVRLRGYEVDGTCSASISLQGVGYWLGNIWYTTGPYHWEQFQRPPASFGAAHTDYGLDLGPDGLYDYLVIEIEVNATRPGTYSIHGQLYGNYGQWIDSTSNSSLLLAGMNTMELRFAGASIRNRAFDGPFRVEVTLNDVLGNWLEREGFNTSAYSWTAFVGPPSFVPPYSDYGLDVNGDGLFEYLVVEIPVNAGTPGLYLVQGWLQNSTGSWIGSAYIESSLNIGLNVVTFRFDGVAISVHNYDGPYHLDFQLGNIVGDYTTAAYLASDFCGPPAVFDPPHSDYGVDTNADGLFDQLVAAVVLDVSKPGLYSIYGDLYDSYGNWIDGDEQEGGIYLESGVQTVELNFSGIALHVCGVDGPYRITLSLSEYDSQWLDDDSFYTGAYLRSEFATPPSFQGTYAEHSADTNADGLFDFLIVEAAVNVPCAGTYEVYGELHDGNGAYVAYASNQTYLDPGIQTVELRFSGYRINIRAIDGPYSVNLQLSADGRTVDQYTLTTVAYAWSEFQTPPKLSPPHSDHGVDADGDGAYDYLALEISVNVPTGGTFRVEAGLNDGFGSFIAWARNETYLPAGLNVVELRFAGWLINENGVSGPFRAYYIDICSIEGEALDYVSNGHLTSAYLPWEFEAAPPSFTVPWLENFETGTLGGSSGVNWSSDDQSFAGVSSQMAGSGTFSMFTCGGWVEVRSYFVDLSGLTSAELRVWVQKGDGVTSDCPDVGDDLEIWFMEPNHDWQRLDTLYGGGVPGETYSLVFTLPADALHSHFQIKFVQTDGDGPGTDYWHIDNVYLGPPL